MTLQRPRAGEPARRRRWVNPAADCSIGSLRCVSSGDYDAVASFFEASRLSYETPRAPAARSTVVRVGAFRAFSRSEYADWLVPIRSAISPWVRFFSIRIRRRFCAKTRCSVPSRAISSIPGLYLNYVSSVKPLHRRGANRDAPLRAPRTLLHRPGGSRRDRPDCRTDRVAKPKAPRPASHAAGGLQICTSRSHCEQIHTPAGSKGGI